MVKNYSEAEVKVREATSNDPWGPSSTLMSEISDLTYNIVALGEVMRMIWKRLNDHGKNWRHVYKSLVLLDYLIKNGNEKVAQQCKEHIVAIQTLKDFQYMDEQKDQGSSVREKAKQLVNLLRDDERLKAERSKAFRARERYAQNAMGISSDNKIIYATGNPIKFAGNSTRSNGGSYADPYGGSAVANNNLAPEIEAVRPSDANEEDLQIKLAIMLSQQEHEDEVSRQRADQAKLQIALEQSKTEGQPNGLVDLGDSDPWASNQTNGKSFNQQKSNNDTDSDDFFPPLSSLKQSQSTSGGLSNNNNAKFNDPWAVNGSASHKPNSGMNGDPWKSTTTTATSANNNGTTNPWLPTTTASIDPWSNSAAASKPSSGNKIDDFDLFTSNRVNTPVNTNTNIAVTTTASSNNNNNNNADPFGDFFGGSATSTDNKNSTNPWNNNTNSNTVSSDPFSSSLTSANLIIQPTNNNTKTVSNPTRKTPESFLGENSSLVNLDNLIPARPKSTNPFGGNVSSGQLATSGLASGGATGLGGLTTSTSSGQLNNPFLAQQQANQKGPSISQLQQQSIFQQQQASRPTTTPPIMQPLIPSSNTTGQLAQPLIPPQYPNMMSAPFMAPALVSSSQPFANSFNLNTTTANQSTSNNNNTNPFLMM